jgi:hypothetical protein
MNKSIKKVNNEIIHLQIANGIKSRKETHEGQTDDGNVFPDAHLFFSDFSF